MEKVAMHQWTRHRRARTNLSLEGTGPAKAKREQRPRKKRTTPADEITEGNKFAVLDEDDLNETQGKCTARGHRSDSLHPPIQTWGDKSPGMPASTAPQSAVEGMSKYVVLIT
jgi:hypothetical protein